MPAATNSVRGVPRKAVANPHSPSIPLSIAPRGNRSLMPTIKRASRITAKNGQRDYGKTEEDAPVAFDLPGYGGL